MMQNESSFFPDTKNCPGTILLVDDSPVNLGVVVENLELHGYDVVVALDGEEALQRVEVASPDLILLDVMMPGINGFEVCSRLKAQDHTRDIPVIFMTSLSSIEEKMRGFAAGGVDYIAKPFLAEEARARINTHLELWALRRKLEVKNLNLEQEVVERKRVEEELSAILGNTPDTIARYDRECRCIYANRALAMQVDGGEAALIGRTPSTGPDGAQSGLYDAKLKEVLASGESAEFELNWMDRDGREICSHVRLTAERDTSGNVTSVLAVGRDISELIRQRQQIYRMAFYDGVTSLPNRALFHDRLKQLLSDAAWHKQNAGVMLIDLDRFKTVNDTFGHSTADKLLCEAGQRLARCVRSYDTVARLGGDEFAVLLPEVRSGDDLGRVASKILDALNAPFLLEGKEVFVSGSIGIAVYPEDGNDAEALLRHADSAMYSAKCSGRAGFRFYSKELTENANERLLLESELRRGFGRGELELYYQPKVGLADGKLLGSEALLRWKHPEMGMVAPDKFIPIAEDSGLIVEIGAWVLQDACLAARAWNGAGMPLHKVAVNLSVRQFQSGNLAATVREVLERTGCRPEWLELEITESLLLDERGEVKEMLESFRSLGITIAIDDFGTGYSSLSYLARFPIDTLKIDRTFTWRVTDGGHHAEVVKAISSIARSLRQQVVAEGVETAEQANILHGYGCDIAQGYLYGRPLPRAEFERLQRMFG